MRKELIETLKRQGYPFIVIVLYSPKHLPEIREGKIDIGKLYDMLQNTKSRDIRIKLSFDPINFNDITMLEYLRYGYPLKTLIEEYYSIHEHPEFIILPPTEENKHLYQAYYGLAIIDNKGNILFYALEYPLKPRKTCILIPRKENTHYIVHAYTAYDKAINVLKAYGYIPVSKYELVKRYANEHEMLKELKKIKDILLTLRIFRFTPSEITRELRRIAA